MLESAPKSAFSQTMYLGCVWKWIRPCKQNTAPESRRASLYSVKVIKMSRLAIDRLFILWLLHVVASLLRKRLHDIFVLRHAKQLERTTPMRPKLLRLLTGPICSRDRVGNFCLRLTEITQIGLLLLSRYCIVVNMESKRNWPSVNHRVILPYIQ